MTPGDTLTDCCGSLTLHTVTDREVTYTLQGSQFRYRVGRDRAELWIEKGFWRYAAAEQDKDKQNERDGICKHGV